MNLADLYNELQELKTSVKDKSIYFESVCNVAALEKAKFKVGDRLRNCQGAVLVRRIEGNYNHNAGVIVMYRGDKLTTKGNKDNRSYGETLYETDDLTYFDQYKAIPYNGELIL